MKWREQALCNATGGLAVIFSDAISPNDPLPSWARAILFVGISIVVFWSLDQLKRKDSTNAN